ncbi:MAG: hypothetical protein P8X57_11860, partial [Cyclobacteriaceae bacterium]
GSYTFEIESGNRIKKFNFKIVDAEVKMDGECISIFKPTFLQNGDILDISYLNVDSGDVNLVLYDPEGNRIMQKDFSGIQSINKRYDLSKLISGSYVVVVQTPERTFKHHVAL